MTNLTCSAHHNHHHKGCSHWALPVRQPGCVGPEQGHTELLCPVEAASLAARHSDT